METILYPPPPPPPPALHHSSHFRNSQLLPFSYILCQKVLHPTKWMLLRGNHETRDMNG